MEIRIKQFNELDRLELYRIIQLRINVFIVEQNCPYPDLDDKDLVSNHVMIWKGDELIAVTRLVPPGISYPNYASIGRVATHATYRGSGLGKLVMTESIKACGELFPGYNIKISAQAYLISFYEAFAFEKIGDEYLEDNIPHVAMIKHSIQRV
ncbi:MAG TPA: GNAT family N-acetyltransferase [Saprospiraceae bacterium]|nr:GNAT family N-acetyltransferase [Saprospiraceae bacterium]